MIFCSYYRSTVLGDTPHFNMVEWFQRVDVNDCCMNSFSCESVRSIECLLNHNSTGEDCDIAAFSQYGESTDF